MLNALLGNSVGVLSLLTVVGAIGVMGFWTWRAMK
ncbi:DUF3149 domain-containing protein [Thermithiobacillus plumbiphilus]|uniref:DUF3149 domain-containing protein n=1 Tax=Thermithiobacillus plumbiphilus TaxID=1729899 RepID=A0ABU9D774_9PROT